jgi:hypothetical protein
MALRELCDVVKSVKDVLKNYRDDKIVPILFGLRQVRGKGGNLEEALKTLSSKKVRERVNSLDVKKFGYLFGHADLGEDAICRGLETLSSYPREMHGSLAREVSFSSNPVNLLRTLRLRSVAILIEKHPPSYQNICRFISSTNFPLASQILSHLASLDLSTNTVCEITSRLGPKPLGESPLDDQKLQLVSQLFYWNPEFAVKIVPSFSSLTGRLPFETAKTLIKLVRQEKKFREAFSMLYECSYPSTWYARKELLMALLEDRDKCLEVCEWLKNRRDRVELYPRLLIKARMLAGTELAEQTAQHLRVLRNCGFSLLSVESGLLDVLDKFPEKYEYVLNKMGRLTNDPTTLVKLMMRVYELHSVFRDKFEQVLDYLVRTRRRFEIVQLDTIRKEVGDLLERVQVGSGGKKRTKKLWRLALLANVALGLGASLDGVSGELEDVYTQLKERIKKYIPEDIPLDRMIQYSDWIKPERQYRAPLRALAGKPIRKVVREVREYPISAPYEVDVQEIAEEIAKYARLMNVQIEKPTDIRECLELVSYLMRKLEREEYSEEVRKEVRPNLSRLSNLTNKVGGEYVVRFDPENLLLQMKALKAVQTCISPGGSYFRYTLRYLGHPCAFYVPVLRKRGEGEEIVGRFTVFVGMEKKGTAEPTHIARVSGVYASGLNLEEEIDKVLRSYANELGLEVVEKGYIRVPGISSCGIYDDYAGKGREKDEVLITSALEKPEEFW